MNFASGRVDMSQTEYHFIWQRLSRCEWLLVGVYSGGDGGYFGGGNGYCWSGGAYGVGTMPNYPRNIHVVHVGRGVVTGKI